MDYYSILGLNERANGNDIKKAWRSMSFKYHPDKNNGDDEKFKSINEAYEVLSDPIKKEKYDMTINPPPINVNGGNLVEDMLNTFLGMNIGTKPKRGNANLGMGLNGGFGVMEMNPDVMNMFMKSMNPNMNMSEVFEETIQPEDVYCDVSISFTQSYTGCTVPVNVEREVVLNKKTYVEKEKIYLTLPPGVDNEEIVTIQGKGNIINKSSGDVKAKIYIHQDTSQYSYERSALDLIYHKTISFRDSICGFDFSITHINDKNLKFDSSRGNIIQNGDKKTIQGKGFKRNGMTGDLVVIFHVDKPSGLNEDQLKMFESVL